MSEHYRHFVLCSDGFHSAIIAKFNVYLMILTFATFANGAIRSVSIKAGRRTKTSASPRIVVEQIGKQVNGLKLSAR